MNSVNVVKLGDSTTMLFDRDLPTLVLMCGCALSVMLLTLAVVLPTPHDHCGTFQGECSAWFASPKRLLTQLKGARKVCSACMLTWSAPPIPVQIACRGRRPAVIDTKGQDEVRWEGVAQLAANLPITTVRCSRHVHLVQRSTHVHMYRPHNYHMSARPHRVDSVKGRLSFVAGWSVITCLCM